MPLVSQIKRGMVLKTEEKIRQSNLEKTLGEVTRVRMKEPTIHDASPDELKLALNMLLHIYMIDDGEITYVEKATLKNTLEDKGFNLTNKERKELMLIIDRPLKKGIVHEYNNINSYSKETVKNAFLILDEVLYRQIHIDILSGIKNTYYSQK